MVSRRRGRRPNRRGANNPLPVACMPVNLRPSFCIPVNVNVSATGSAISGVSTPSTLSGKAWRVTSIQVTLAFSAAAATCIIRLHGNEPGGNTVTAQSRILVGAVGHQEVKMRNARHVQHQVGTASNLVDFVTNGTISIVGVIYVSVVGSF
jgi:hypothetical protein